MENATNKSLRTIVDTMSKDREYSHPLVYAMVSFAEFINPGAVYEKVLPESHCLNYSEDELAKIRKERLKRIEEQKTEEKGRT